MKLVRSLPGARMLASYRAVVVAARRRRRPRADHAAGTPGDGLRPACRPAGDHRAVHVGPLPDRLRGVRAFANPRAGPGFLPGSDDRGDDPADHRIRRRSRARGRVGVDAGPAGGRHHDRCGDREAGVHRRPSFEADADRIHERACPDDPHRAAAEAPWVLDRREWADRRDTRVRGRDHVGRGGCGRCSDRIGQSRADPRHPAMAASDTRRPARSGGRDRRRRGVQPRRPWRVARGDPSGGPSLPHLAEPGLRSAAPGGRSARHRARLSDRHDLDRLVLCLPHGSGGRREPGDDRNRRREHRRRASSRASP